MARDATISLAELGEHVGELRRMHREAMSDDSSPVAELSFADVRARCHAILGMLERAEGSSATDADIDDPNKTDRSIHPVTGGPPLRGNDNPPRTRGAPTVPGRMGSDAIPLAECFGAATNAQRRRAASAVFGLTDTGTVADILARSRIKTPELKSRKLKK